MTTRRALLAGAATLLADATLAHPARAAPTYCIDADATPIIPRRATPLGALNARVRWGVAAGQVTLDDERLRALIAAEQPRVVAIADGLKFDHLYAREPAARAPLASVANWSDCDAVLSFAQRLGVPVRGDCLTWNDWVAPWLTTLARRDPERVRDLLRDHFDTVFARLAMHGDATDPTDAPTIAWAGVVNEPFNPWGSRGDGAPAWRDGAWLTAFGMAPDGVPAYIHSAFALGDRFARPRTKLFINETNCDNDRYGPRMRPAMLDMIDKLQRAGRRVDAVGLECHLMPQWMTDPLAPDWRPFVAFCNEIGRRGIDVYLTELDVLDCARRDAVDRDRLVADTMRSFVSAALQSPAVRMVTNWDLSDTYSWLRESGLRRTLPTWAGCGAEPPCPRPTPYDANYQPKRAREALADALADTAGAAR